MTTENNQSWTGAFFGNVVMQKLGALSFAIYCLHSPVFVIVENIKNMYATQSWKIAITYSRIGNLEYWEIIPIFAAVIALSFACDWIHNKLSPKLNKALLFVLGGSCCQKKQAAKNNDA